MKNSPVLEKMILRATLAAAFLLMPITTRAADTLISAQFESSDVGQAVNYSGVERQAAQANPVFALANVWNHLQASFGQREPFSFPNLVNRSGVGTGASLSLSAGWGGYNAYYDFPSTYLYGGGSFAFNGLPPNQSFVLFIYAFDNSGDRDAIVTVGSSNLGITRTQTTGMLTGTTSGTGTIVGTWSPAPGNSFGEVDWSGFQLYVKSPGDLGEANVCPAGQGTPAPCNRTSTLGFNVSAGTTLGAPNVVTSGAPNLDFTLASGGTCIDGTYFPADSTCTVNVMFSPKFSGARNGAVVLTDSDGDTLATTYLQGTGTGPQIAFSPAMQTTVPASGLYQPFGVAVDGSGNVYITDPTRNRVLKETLSGGTYTQTTIGSDLSLPWAVAVDGSGNVYITDSGNSRVLKESLSGGTYTQTTVATGSFDSYGLTVDGSGNVYIADTGNNQVLLEMPAGGTYTQTTIGSGLLSPTGVALDDKGNLYIADAGNNRVLKETLSGATYTQTTIVSNLSKPIGLAVDGGGNVYIADSGTNRVLKEMLSGGTYTETTMLSNLSNPTGLVLDGGGNVYIADSYNGRVLEENVITPPSLSFASTPAGSTSSDSPQTVTLANDGNAPLSFLAPAAGTNPSVSAPFSFDSSSTCPQLAPGSSPATLASGSSCTLSFSFTPTISGPFTGTASVTDNNLNLNSATQIINLSGTATQHAQTITFSPIPSALQSTTVTLTASATSGLQVSFQSLTPSICTVSGTTATLVSVGTCTIQAMQAGNSLYQAAPPVSQSFSVTFAFTGFFQPVNNPPTVNLVQAGRAIPVTFSLGGNQGSNILAAGYPISNPVSCTSGAPTSDIGQTVTAGSSSLGYSATSNQYTYVWKTNKSWSGTCQQFILTLTDGTTHTATFQFN